MNNTSSIGNGKSGTVALVGSGEYLPAMEPVDRVLLAHLDAPARVVVLPTASAPDGPGVPQRWARMGVDHFTRLGAQVQPIMLLTREDAENTVLAEQIASANFIYFSGGKPRYLLETLQGTPAWQAVLRVYQSGGVLAGCSAGAMVLGGELPDIPQVWRTLPALGLVPKILVIPHFDELPGRLASLIDLSRPDLTLVGVDGMTALVGHNGGYTVSGRGGVTLMTPGSKTRYHDGQKVVLPEPPPAFH
jgi:cyanophycinase-like exopeptidase